MNKPITDRPPTEADGPYVLCWNEGSGRWLSRSWENVIGGNPWLPQPPAPEPTKPDTSLAASIERLTGSGFVYPAGKQFLISFEQDLDRILDAAKKWEAVVNQGKTVQGFSAGDFDESPEPPKQKRREFTIDPYRRGHLNVSAIDSDGYHELGEGFQVRVREVLPTDPADLDEFIKVVNFTCNQIEQYHGFGTHECTVSGCTLSRWVTRLRKALEPKE